MFYRSGMPLGRASMSQEVAQWGVVGEKRLAVDGKPEKLDPIFHLGRAS